MVRLPEKWLSFLIENEIDPSIYSKDRNIRYSFYFDNFTSNNGEPVNEVPGLIRAKLNGLSNIALSIDIWSAYTVQLLEPNKDEHFLDLCCAPGAKLVLASKLGFSTVTGVDVSRERLFTARSLIKRYKIGNVRLFHQDGRFFVEGPQSIIRGCRQKPSPPKNCFYASSVYRKSPSIVELNGLNTYHKVLVDAQCTHDGSIKHVLKNIKSDWTNFHWTQLENLDELYVIQLELLLNGYKLVKPGGLLIYSTCSLSKKQNEDIVAKFRAIYSDALPYDFGPGPASMMSKNGMLRVEPNDSKIDLNVGFFIARFRKPT